MASFFTDKMQAIRPLISHATRPFWSVMIPTYKARPDYLEETLESVLQQDPGPAQMQIEVLDDCSPGWIGPERELGGRLTDHFEIAPGVIVVMDVDSHGRPSL